MFVWGLRTLSQVTFTKLVVDTDRVAGMASPTSSITGRRLVVL
jgi:hypothetical protein